MPEVILHQSCLSVAPAWEGGVFQPHVAWLNSGPATDAEHLNDPLQAYRESYPQRPVSIHGLGILRPIRRAALYEHLIWRSILEMDRAHKQFNPARLHLVPLIVRPRRRLVVAYPEVHSATLSIYVTPQAVRTQATVAFTLGSLDQVKDIKAAACMLDGRAAGRLEEVVRAMHAQALAGLFAEPARARLAEQPPIEHSAISLDNPRLDLQSTARLLKSKQLIKCTARPVEYPWDSAWKLIDHHTSVVLIDEGMIQAARSKEYWSQHKSCHFNNWNDLRFVYESLYYSFLRLREWLDSHPHQPVSPATVIRLGIGYNAYQAFRERSGWNPVIAALEGCYEGAHTISEVYERLQGLSPLPQPAPPAAPAPADDRYRDFEPARLVELRAIQVNNLTLLAKQKALSGITVPLSILNQIDDCEKELKAIEAELARRQVAQAA